MQSVNTQKDHLKIDGVFYAPRESLIRGAYSVWSVCLSVFLSVFLSVTLLSVPRTTSTFLIRLTSNFTWRFNITCSCAWHKFHFDPTKGYGVIALWRPKIKHKTSVPQTTSTFLILPSSNFTCCFIITCSCAWLKFHFGQTKGYGVIALWRLNFYYKMSVRRTTFTFLI